MNKIQMPGFPSFTVFFGFVPQYMGIYSLNIKENITII